MPDFIDRLGAELVRAVTAEPRRSRIVRISSRLRSMRARGMLIVPALAILGTGAAVASGILLTGSPVGPRVPPVPTAGFGAATPATAKLLPLRVADPAGGPPWGLRLIRTTRDDACLQVGRLANGTIGALGQDGAFGDDHRFHPFSDNYQGPLGCVPLDARGHGFTSDALWGLPTSAMGAGGCRAGRKPTPCPARETRDIYSGLLGPEAASITYVSDGGQKVTVPTAGSDGAYLIVTRPRHGEQQGAGARGSYDVGLFKIGAIYAVTYRDGHTCRPTAAYACGPIGLVPAHAPHLPQDALVSPIRVQVLPDSGSVPPSLRLRVTYTARVAVTSTSSFYYTSLFFPHTPACDEIATGSETTTNIRAGQRVTDDELVSARCHGVVRGLVRYHPASAVHSPAPEPDAVDLGDIAVGRFSFRIP